MSNILPKKSKGRPNAIGSLFSIPGEVEVKQYRGFGLLTMIGALGLIAHIIFLLLFLVFEVYPMVYFNVMSCLIFIVIFLGRKGNTQQIVLLILLGFVEIVSHATASVLLLGWDSNFHCYIFLAMISTSLLPHFSRRLMIVVSTLSAVLYVGLLINSFEHAPLFSVPENITEMFGLLNLILSTFMVITVMIYFRNLARKETKIHIASREALKEQSDQLSNVLKLALHDKEVMVKELHHRIKNSLNMVTGINFMKSLKTENEEIKTFICDLNTRIKSIASVYEEILEFDKSSQISIRDYLLKIIDQSLMNNRENRNIHLNEKITDFKVDFDKALSIGFIVSEAITNSRKHAFQGIDRPEITVTLEENANEVEMKIYDNGIGISEKHNSDGIGLTLMETFTNDLEATLVKDYSSGTLYKWNFTSN